MAEALLELRNVSKSYAARRGRGRSLRAVAGACFTLAAGETLGLVGESGCGKSTLARLALRLIEPDTGTVCVAGQDFTGTSGAATRRLRRRVQIVFQDALSSLNPRMSVGVNVAEPIRLQSIGSERERRSAALELLDLVGLRPEHADRLPAVVEISSNWADENSPFCYDLVTPISAWRFDLGKIVQVEVDDGLQGFGGGSVTQGVRQGIGPTSVFGLESKQLSDGVVPALWPEAAVGWTAIADRRGADLGLLSGTVASLSFGIGDGVDGPQRH